MRIYNNPVEAVREVERDLFEMGIRVHPQTMQDKNVAMDKGYDTLEVRAYGFQVSGWTWCAEDEALMVNYVLTGKTTSPPHAQFGQIMKYVEQEFSDRVGGVPLNPGNSYQHRLAVWNEFLHDGKFSYTYSERISPQLPKIMQELRLRPDTRQGIINIHSNVSTVWYDTDQGVAPGWRVERSQDLQNTGGTGRIPCSMYYQLMIRESKVDLIYTMRSCDFLTHFPVDIALALRLQDWAAKQLGLDTGRFTYFTGSLHAYQKDLETRGIF